MTRAVRLAGALLAGLFLALHLPFLPPSLEDLDSINFALGVRDFDVSKHQPHPPGYPLFIVAAKAVHATGVSEVRALSLVNLAGGAVAIFGALMLFGALDRDRRDDWLSWADVLLVAVCPLLWVTAARPLSDTAGLGPTLVAQALIVRAANASAAGGLTALTWAAASAGLAAGIRSQAVWLTVPLLLLVVLRVARTSGAGAIVRTTLGYVAGVLVWLVPLVVVSGGPLAYWRAFADQGAEDLSGVAMLATTHDLRLVVTTVRQAFVEPWGHWQMASAVLALSAVGLWHLWRTFRWAFVTLLAAFGPYLVFDLLFQEAITTRYALPLVVPVAYLAGRGLTLLPRSVVGLSALGFAVAAIFANDQVMYGYAQMDAPAFRMLADMKLAAAELGSRQPVLAMHRKDEFDMRRSIQWVGADMPVLARRLPAPPKHEWLELVKYWNEGGRDPVWFVADPPRSDLALVGHRERPSRYRWPFVQMTLIGGARPNEMDWHTISSPDWYLGEGWALTPETAGVARENRRGPGYGPISGWVRRAASPLTLVVGGRNLVPGGPSAAVRVKLDDVLVGEWPVAPGFFLRMLSVLPSSGPGDYAHLTIESDSTELAIEQFDAQPAGTVVFGFADGWNEQEYNPGTGVLWRWSTDRSVLRVRAEGHRVALTLRGEIEAAKTSKIRVLAGGTVVSEFEVEQQFSRTILIPASALSGPETDLTIESSAWYVPAESRWRSQDRRRLGLKLFECRVTPAS